MTPIMENVSVQRLPDGNTRVTGLSHGKYFEAILNEKRTGGIIKYANGKMEAIGSRYMLGQLLEEIEKASRNDHVDPVVLNAIAPFLPDCPQCETELKPNLIDNQSKGHCNCEARGQ